MTNAGSAFNGGSLTRRCAPMAETMRTAITAAAAATTDGTKMPTSSRNARESLRAPIAFHAHEGRP